VAPEGIGKDAKVRRQASAAVARAHEQDSHGGGLPDIDTVDEPAVDLSAGGSVGVPVEMRGKPRGRGPVRGDHVEELVVITVGQSTAAAE